MGYIKKYCEEAIQILEKLDQDKIQKIVDALLEVRRNGGRLFFLGVGGSAANCVHAVNDFRKIGRFEAYSPCENIAELTARTNDEGWDTVFLEWLRGSRLNSKDAVWVLSVGGGSRERGVSANLVNAVEYSKEVGAAVLGVVGKPDGFTAQVGDACVVVPEVNPATVTPHSESFQAVVWHLIVSHPDIMQISNKWESLSGPEEAK